MNDGTLPLMWVVFVWEGKVLAPMVAKTADGLIVHVDPVEVAPLGETEKVRSAVATAIKRGNPIVPRTNFDVQWAAFKDLGAKKLRTFEKSAEAWKIIQAGQYFEIGKLAPLKKGRGWNPEPIVALKLPISKTADEIAAQVAELIRSSR